MPNKKRPVGRPVKPDKATIQVTMTKDIEARILSEAEKEDRSKSNMALRLIIESLERRGA